MTPKLLALLWRHPISLYSLPLTASRIYHRQPNALAIATHKAQHFHKIFYFHHQRQHSYHQESPWTTPKEEPQSGHDSIRLSQSQEEPHASIAGHDPLLRPDTPIRDVVEVLLTEVLVVQLENQAKNLLLIQPPQLVSRLEALSSFFFLTNVMSSCCRCEDQRPDPGQERHSACGCSAHTSCTYL